MSTNKLNFNKFRIARLIETKYIVGGVTDQNQGGATDPPTNPKCILTSIMYEGTGNENNTENNDKGA